jgi:hypothetical protein
MVLLGPAEGDGIASASATALTTSGGLIGEGDGAASATSQIGGRLQIAGEADGSTLPALAPITGTTAIVRVAGEGDGSTATAATIAGCSNAAPLAGECNTGSTLTAGLGTLPQFASTIYGYAINRALLGIIGVGEAEADGASSTATGAMTVNNGLLAATAGASATGATLRVQSIFAGEADGNCAPSASIHALAQLWGHCGAIGPELFSIAGGAGGAIATLTITGAPTVELESSI